MSAARLPIQYRDSCAHLLIPLNRCRYEEYYLPWKCEVRISHPHPYLHPQSKIPRSTNPQPQNQPYRKANPEHISPSKQPGKESDSQGRKYGREKKRLTKEQDERHTYEKCQYEEFKKRVAKMDELRAAKGGARSN